MQNECMGGMPGLYSNLERNLHPPTKFVDLRAYLKSSEFPGSDSKFHEIQYFHVFKKRVGIEVSFKSVKKSCFFSKSWKFWKKRCFDELQTVRFHFFKKIKNHHLGLTARAKSRNNTGKAWFWWALDTVISLFQKKMLFVEIVAIHCVLRQKNTKF